MKFIFPAIAISILTGLVWYLGVRLINPLQITALGRGAFWTILISLVGFTFGSFLAPRLMTPSKLSLLLEWGGYLSLGLLSMFLAFVFVRDILWVGVNSIDFLGDKLGFWDKFFIGELSRKVLAGSGLSVIGLSLLLLGLGTSRAMMPPKLVEVSVPVKNDALNGYTIVLLSDLHVGMVVRASRLEELVNRINVIKPDAIMITGDLIEGNVKHVSKELEPLLELTPPDGIFYVTGNHEYYWEPQEWVDFLKKHFTVLSNEHQVIELDGIDLVIAGIPDPHASVLGSEFKPNPSKAIENAPSNSYKILLAHQPPIADKASELGYDLQLSGHTHAGQFFPWTWVIHLVQPYVKGLVKIGDMYLYTTPGTFFWGPPIRLGSSSELTVLKLKYEII